MGNIWKICTTGIHQQSVWIKERKAESIGDIVKSSNWLALCMFGGSTGSDSVKLWSHSHRKIAVFIAIEYFSFPG